MTGGVLLEVEGLVKEFMGLRAVDRVSFRLPPGSITGLIGPNGAGKTTLFNVLTGLLRPEAGRVTFRGRDITAAPPHRIARLGMARTFQNLQIFSSMSVLDNVLTGCQRHGHHGLLSIMFRLPSARREEARLREKARRLQEELGHSHAVLQKTIERVKRCEEAKRRFSQKPILL